MKKFLSFLMMTLLAVTAWAENETITFSDYGFEDAQVVTEVKGEYFTMTFNRGDAWDDTWELLPVYDAEAYSLRVYSGNKFTVKSPNRAITRVAFTFGTGDDPEYGISSTIGSFEVNTWTGSSTIVEFSVAQGASLGYRRIKSVTVTFEDVVTVNSIEEFNNLPDNTVLKFNGFTTVIAPQRYNMLHVQDDTHGMFIYGGVNQEFEPGDVVPPGFYARKSTQQGAPVMINVSNMLPSVEKAEYSPIEILMSQVNSSEYLFRYVEIKKVTVANYHLVSGDESVLIHNRFVLDLPEDSQREFDVLGIVSYNSQPTFIPLSFNERLFNVNVIPSEHGHVIVSQTKAGFGTEIEVFPYPDYGYELESLNYTYDPNPSGVVFPIEDNKFEMPDIDVNVYATFKPSTFNIAIADGFSNGSVAIVGDKTTATAGETVKVVAVPATAYEVKAITATYAVSGGTGTIDLVAVPDEPNTYSFVMPAADVTVNVTFGLHAYNITLASDIEHGTVTFSPETATVGETVTVTATADEHYELTSLYYTYEEVTAPIRVDILNGQFVMPASDVVITAVFSPIYYTIGTSVIPQNTGTITVQDRATFNEEVTVTATANEGYQLKRLYYYFNAGGGIDAEYTIDNGTFAMPAINIIVAAEFEPAVYPIIIGATENGTVEANPTGAHQGDEVVLTVAPDEGYELESLTVTTVETEGVEPQPGKAAENVELTKTGEFTYAFVMPGKSVNVTATFKESPLTGINGIRVDLHEGMRFVNPLGQVSNRPFRGVNIVIDGDKTYKVVF